MDFAIIKALLSKVGPYIITGAYFVAKTRPIRNESNSTRKEEVKKRVQQEIYQDMNKLDYRLRKRMQSLDDDELLRQAKSGSAYAREEAISRGIWG